MLPSLGHFSEIPCVFFLAGSCNRPHCHFRHCARDKTNDDGKLPSLPKAAKDGEKWLGPSLRLFQITQMVEKAVDRALLANPDKNLDRASMISKALETLRRDSLASKTGVDHKNGPPNPSTSTGFPSYKPTPISILNKRHIPVVAMPVKPMVIRKDKRPDEKTLIGTLPVTSALHTFTSHTSKPNATFLPNSTANLTGPLDENSGSQSENSILLDQQISEFLGTEIGADCSITKTTCNDNEPSSPPFSLDSGSSEHSNNDCLVNGTSGKPQLEHVISNPCNNSGVSMMDKESDPLLYSAVGLGNKTDVPPSSIESDECQQGQKHQGGEVAMTVEQKDSVPNDVPSTAKSEEIRDVPDLLPPKPKAKDHQGRSNSVKTSDRRRSADTNKSSDSKKKSEKSVHRSSKSDHRKHSEKEKNGDDSQKIEKPMKDSERESHHKKPSLHHANFPKKCLRTEDRCTSQTKKSDKDHDKKSHHKSQDKDNQKHEEKHHSHKNNHAENCKKRESRDEKSKISSEHSSKTSKHSSSSRSKSKSSEKLSSSHSKDRDKAKKCKADDDNEKPSKVAKIATEFDTMKEKKPKSDTRDTCNQIVEEQPRRDSGSRASRESSKRKRHSESDNDVDFINSPSPDHTAIVISSSSSDEFQVVDFRWSKAKEIIQRSTNSKMARIAHVPNVMNFLTAKTRLKNSQEKIPSNQPVPLTPSPSTTNKSNESDEGPLPKIVKRVAHGSQGAESRPVVKHCDSVRLPLGVRQHYCNIFYEELCKYLDPDKAKKLAVEEELDIAKRCKIHKIYQNHCSLLLLKIRKLKGKIDKGEEAAEKWTGSSTPEFTYGLPLYKCFEKYLVSEEDLIKNGYAMPLPGQPTCAYIEKGARKYSVQQPDEPFKRRCVNCRKTYEIDQEGMPTTMNDCNYHWGRMRRVGGRSLLVEKYTCCDGADDSLPCQSNAYHVWSGKNEDCIPGFVRTKEWPTYKEDVDAGVYALDCEMCYTTRGLELARLTVIDLNEDVIYDEVVALDHPVLDYCTRFSGIDEDRMRQATCTFQDVRNWVMDKFFDKTILIGHSLENDLNALKVFHKRVVDTSILFPHKFGPPMKNSLKNLAMSMLALSIQENEKGHDSKEDAATCLKLMMKRIKEDAKVRKPRVIIGYAGKKR